MKNGALGPVLYLAMLAGPAFDCLGAEGAPRPSSLGQPIVSFTLRDYRGAERSLAEFEKSRLVVIAFLGTDCPLVRLYGPRLAQLEAEFAPRGVAFLGINANRQDSASEIGHYALLHGIKFPILKDVGNVVADRFGALRTPEVFVLDEKRVVRYHGRIDDQYAVGVQRPQPTRRDLAIALEELLAGNPVSTPETEAAGCYIGRVAEAPAEAEVTYSREIAPILQQRCVECHRPGEIAPFALTSYEEVAGWAETIAEVVREERMPPWHADPRHGKFANDARLAPEEKERILRWAASGAPEGDPKDLPPPRAFTQGWRIPEPDLVVSMSDEPYQVPAEGEVRYQYFVVDPGFKEDKWVQAAECRPGNRAVVHHIIVGVRPPGGKRRAAGVGELDSDWLAATAPGARPMILRPGMAKRIPAGSQLVFQMHYTPNGSPQTDRSSIGLVFADPGTVKKEVVTSKAANTRLAIPPHEGNHRVEAWHEFRRDTLLLALFPHMHLRGKSFRYEAHYPGGEREVLLDVPRYDFNWQNTYELVEPKRLPAGTRLHCIAHFDNSQQNLANPDPTKTVRWGDQTWEEMMIGYFDAAPADEDARSQAPSESRTARFLASKERPSLDAKTTELARQALGSQEAFVRFALAVQQLVPQLDRICLTVVSEGKLRVERDAQAAALRQHVGGRGIEVPAAGLALAGYAEREEAVVHQDLAEAKGADLRLMQRAFASSLHVPVRVDGRPATLNFWSEEREAFPPHAVELLKQAARLAVGE